jgi:UDP-glucose:(heptosyl)LPS alpha-1,3-glucosyltransferase
VRIGMSAHRFNHEGGIERASYELATALGELGSDVTLIAESVDPPAAAPLHWQPVRMPKVPGFAVPAVYPRRATKQTAGKEYDILHNQGACALMTQDVITAHSCHRAWWEMKLRGGEATRALLNPLHHVVLATERHNYRPDAYRRVIAVSDGVGRELTHHYHVPPERIRVIPNAVDIAKFQMPDAAESRSRVRAELGIRPDAHVLLFVGKEFRRKGLGPIVAALPKLPGSVVLLVVGGDDQTPFRAQAHAAGVGDRVFFAGHSPRVQDYFAAGDAFVFPTLYEAFALVSLEAAAAGLPLLTTKVNGTEDFVVDGVNGFFIEREAGSIATAVDRLIGDPSLMRSMGEAARAGVAAYTWDRIAARTRDVYAEVAEEKRALTRA